MCKSKTRTDATDPASSIRPRTTRPTPPFSTSYTTASSTAGTSSASLTTSSASTTTSSTTATSSSSSSSSRSSLAGLSSSLPEKTRIFSYQDISSATNNFLSKPFSSSSSSKAWRCTLRSKPVVIIQRRLRRGLDDLRLRHLLFSINRCHHTSIIKLLGASVSGDHIYLVYDYVPGANLSDCLHNPKNPNFTVLSTWLSRMQIAADLAQGLEYMHHSSGVNPPLVHNHIKSTSIIVTDPSLNAMLCHFGTTLLTGEIPDGSEPSSSSSSSSIQFQRSDSRVSKMQGTPGYMSPEFLKAGIVSQKSDVFAYGVVLLELMSGEEPLKYRFDKKKGDYDTISLTEKAREALERARDGMLRQWMDRRMRDSFPVEVAEKMTRVALDCVHVEADKRPDMRRVAGKVSKLLLESKEWADRLRVPTEFSVSMAPR